MDEDLLQSGLLKDVVSNDIAARLRSAGIYTPQGLAFHTISELAEILPGVSEHKLKEILKVAWKVVGGWPTPVSKLELRRETYTTGCSELDHVLGGGYETGALTEIAGPFGTGKTQACFTAAAVNLALNPEIEAVFIDSEGTFELSRIEQILNARGYKDQIDSVSNRIHYSQIFNRDHYCTLIEEILDKFISDHKGVRLLLVDGIIGPLRAELTGREHLAERQQLLNHILRKLLNAARAYNLAVIFTNQVVGSPTQKAPWELDYSPAGGHILAHAPNTRILLRKAKENTRIAKIHDSPKIADTEVAFQITEAGIENYKPKKET